MASPPKSPDTIQVVLDLDRHQLAALIQGLDLCPHHADLRGQLIAAKRQLTDQLKEALMKQFPHAREAALRPDLESIGEIKPCPICDFVLDPNGECVNHKCPNWIKE